MEPEQFVVVHEDLHKVRRRLKWFRRKRIKQIRVRGQQINENVVFVEKVISYYESNGSNHESKNKMKLTSAIIMTITVTFISSGDMFSIKLAMVGNRYDSTGLLTVGIPKTIVA